MRRIALAALLAALAFATGCFAFDEVDRGRAEMKKHAGGYRAEGVPAPKPKPAEPEEEDGEPGLVARAQALWAKLTAEKPVERPADDEIIRCNLPDGVTFTYESDCLSRGGDPAAS